MSIPGLVPQSGEYTPFLERTGGMLGDWNSRLVSVIGALSQQMHASRYVAVAVFTVANVVAFYAIRAFVSRLEPGPAAPSPATDDGPHQDAKPLQSILCPILVGAAGYGVNTALAKATHYSIHPFILTAIAVAMSATYHLTRQSHIQPPASSVSSQPTHLPTSSSTPPRPPSVRTSSISPSPNPAASTPPPTPSSSPTVSTPQNQISPVPPVIVSLQPSDGVTAFHSLQPLNHSNVKTIQTTKLSTNIDFYRARSDEHVPPLTSITRRPSLESEEDRDDGFHKPSDCDFHSALRERSASESKVESHFDPYDHHADQEGDEGDHTPSSSLSRSSSEQSLGDNNLPEEGDEGDHTPSSSLSRSSSEQSLGDNNLPEEGDEEDPSPSSSLSRSSSEQSLGDNDLSEEGDEEDPSSSSNLSGSLSSRSLGDNDLSEEGDEDDPVLSDEEDLSSQKIQEYIEVDNLEKALKANKQCSYQQQQENACQIANAYFQRGNLEKAIEILTSIVGSEIRDPIYQEFARSCCLQSKYEDAIKCINKISYFSGDRIMDKIFLEVATQHRKNGNYEKAEETIHYLKDKPGDTFEDFCLDTSRGYIQQGELDKAARTLGKIIYKTEERNEIFSELAKKYYENNDLENAVKFNIYNNNHAYVKTFYIQIAQRYKTQGDDAKAINVLRMIARHGSLVDVQNALIVRDFLNQNNFDLALEGIVRSSIRARVW